MTPQEIAWINAIIEDEGFDYAFAGYSDFKQVEDVEFHRLRTVYLAARLALAAYIGADDDAPQTD